MNDEGTLSSIFGNAWHTNESESQESFLLQGLEVATPPVPQQEQAGDGDLSWMEDMMIINDDDAFVHGDQLVLLTGGFPQQADEVALWTAQEPPLDLFASSSDPLDLEPAPGIHLQPSGSNNNYHFFTHPNSLWAVVSPIPTNFATSGVPLVELNQHQSHVVNQVVEQGDGGLLWPKVLEQGDDMLLCPKVAQGEDVLPCPKVVEQGDGMLPCPKVVEKGDDVLPFPKAAEQGDGSSTPSKKMRKSHNSCERRRRDKINERINHLRELVPGCSKRDKASLLEQTCSYLKSLQDHVNKLKMLSLESNYMRMRMGMGMGMGVVVGMNPQPMMVPFPALVPGSTWQNPANTAAQFPTVADMHGQYLSSHPTGYLQAKNKETLQLTDRNTCKITELASYRNYQDEGTLRS